MADYSQEINDLAAILTTEFSKQAKGGKLNPQVVNFWSKAKKIFSEDLVSGLELRPEEEATQATLVKELGEQFQNQRFVANVAMFTNLYERSK